MPQETKNDDAGKWVFMKGDQLFVLDSEDRLQPLELRVISQHQAERLQHLERSFTREKV